MSGQPNVRTRKRTMTCMRTIGAICSRIQIAYAVRLLLIFVLFFEHAWSQPPSGATGCSENGGPWRCERGNLFFTPTVGIYYLTIPNFLSNHGNSPEWSTGLELCEYTVARVNEYEAQRGTLRLSAPAYWVNQLTQYGQNSGCEWNRTFEGVTVRIRQPGVAVPDQKCSSGSKYVFIDGTDNLVDIRGRLWCGYDGSTPSRFTAQQKGALLDAANLLRTTRWITPIPAVFLCFRSSGPGCLVSVVPLFYKLWAYLQEEEDRLRKIAEDPPDTNYTEIAYPIIPTPAPVSAQAGVSQKLADAFNILAANLGRTVALERAIYTTINRATGAFQASDVNWQRQQLLALSAYEAELADRIRQQIVLREDFRTSLLGSGYSEFPVPPSDLRQFQQVVAASGLPADLRSALLQAGSDDVEIAAITSSLASQDVSSLSGTFPASLAYPARNSASLAAAQALQDASLNNGVALPCATDVTSQIAVTMGGFRLNPTSGRFVQVVTMKNLTALKIGQLSLVLDRLSTSATVFNRSGSTSCAAPAGSYVDVYLGPTGTLEPGASTSVIVEFVNPTRQSIQYSPRALAGAALR